MSTIVYVGPSDAVDLPGGIRATKGEPVEVATDLAKSLLEQDTFEKPTARKSSAAKKAAGKPSAPADDNKSEED